MNRRAHFFQHVHFETPAGIGTWLSARQFSISSTAFHEHWTAPDLNNTDLLIIMGGPMGVYDYDSCPYLHAEKQFISQAIDSGMHVLGICLGAQLIADVLGSRVIKNKQKEIGWFPIEKINDHPAVSHLPEKFHAFSWHGDTFGLPDGAVHLFKSEATANQGFIYNDRVLALQFHLEADTDQVGKLVKNCGNELTEAPFIHNAERLMSDTEKFTEESNRLLFSMLDSFILK